jgi:hypothetical protein
MSEAELHIMRARLEGGRWNKAGRGEFGFNMPRGYLKRPSGEVCLDPDERVRETVRLVFDVFERRCSVHGVMRYLVDHSIALPDRARSGPARGEVVWRRPHRGSIINMLTNPTYAGAYAYGRRGPDERGVAAGRHRRARPSRDPEDWRVLLQDRWPAYITWDTFEENQRRLMANRSKHRGVPRGGPSLLAGLLYCGRCGCRMVTCYRNNGRDLRYGCTRHQVNYGAPHCQALSGAALDALVSGLVLEVLRPSAVEVSLAMAEDVELERTARQRQWALRLEQARYGVERAERQYNAVEPENRLVVRTLERRWEEALAAEAALREEHTRFLAREPIRLSAADREAIRRLSEDVPALWHAGTTTGVERKEIARLLLERVEVVLQGDTERAEVTCVWAGGGRTAHALVRSVRRASQLSRHADLIERIRVLHHEGSRPPAITRVLVGEGWRSAHGKPYRESGVRSLMTRMGLIPARLARPSAVVARSEGEFTPTEIAARLNMAPVTVYTWIYKGRLTARRAAAADRSLWLVRLDEVEHLLRQRGRGGRLPARQTT